MSIKDFVYLSARDGNFLKQWGSGSVRVRQNESSVRFEFGLVLKNEGSGSVRVRLGQSSGSVRFGTPFSTRGFGFGMIRVRVRFGFEVSG